MGLVLVALAAPRAAAAADFAARLPKPCGQHMVADRMPVLTAPASPTPGPIVAKGERDLYALPNALASTNFRILWGNGNPVNAAQAQTMLDALEHAWTTEVEEMSYPAPARTEDWLFNVYVGDSGDGAPPSNGAAGYATFDEEGYPMLVLAQDIVAAGDSFAESTCAHEFFHAIQASSQRFPYDGLSAWLWEATAVWMQYQVYPQHPDYATFLFGYTYLPHYPLNAFDYADSGALQEYHQYGAFIFPHYVTEQVADESIVREMWFDESDESDPLVVMANLLDGRGHDFHEVWLDHLAHDVLWDYEDHDNLVDYATRYDANWMESDNVILAEVPPEGTGGLVLAPEETWPRRLGSNVWRMQNPPDGNLRFEVHGVTDGEVDDVPAHWGARIVRQYADHIEYVAVPFTLDEFWVADFLLEDVGDEQAIWLVVGAWTDDPAPLAWASEAFAYEFAITPEAPEPMGTTGDSSSSGGDETSSSSNGDDESTTAIDPSSEGSESSSSGAGAAHEDDGCGCTSAPSRGSALALLLALGLRRRRAQQKSSSEPSPQS